MNSCPICGDQRAKCIVGNFYLCPNPHCKNFAKPKETKKPAPVKEPTKLSDLSKFGAIGHYSCDKCKIVQLQFIDDVAAGERCKCGGSLTLMPQVAGFPGIILP